LSQLKKHRPSGNLEFHYLGIFQTLKLRIFIGKILPISLKLNFTPNTLGCYGLIRIKLTTLIKKYFFKNEKNTSKFALVSR